MVTRKQHIGHTHAAPYGRPRVLSVLEQRFGAGIRFLHDGFRIAHEPWQQARNRLQHHRYCDFAAVEHIIADRILAHIHALCPIVCRNTRIIALIAPTSEHQPFGVAELGRVTLRKQGCGRIGEDEHGIGGMDGSPQIITGLRILQSVTGSGLLCRSIGFGGRGGTVGVIVRTHILRLQAEQIIKALRPDLRLHDHAGASADRSIIHRMMHVMRPVAQIMGVDADKPLALRLAEQAQVQHVEVFGEHGNDIDLHAHHCTGPPPQQQKRQTFYALKYVIPKCRQTIRWYSDKIRQNTSAMHGFDALALCGTCVAGRT